MELQEQGKSCLFCTDIQTKKCLNRSLYNKHDDASERYIYLIDEIIHKEKCPNRIK